MQISSSSRLVRPLFWGLVCALFLIRAQASDALLDFSVIHPPAAQDRVIKDPVLTWSVQSDLEAVMGTCKGLTDFDGAGVWREGCVAWSVDSSRCTIVTSSSSSHSLMGYLLVMCMMAGKLPS
jgi:hypothetical protein